MKTAERLRARALRAERGLSIKRIAAMLDVSPGTVSVWVRDIELTYAQREALASRNPALNPSFSGSKTGARRALVRRLAHQAEGRALAACGEPAFAAGCALFWAEGSRDRNSVKFTNSDPEMVAFFLQFLRHYFNVSDDMVAVWCNLFADDELSRERIERFWLAKLELPDSSLRKSTVNVYSKHSSKLRKNKLP